MSAHHLSCDEVFGFYQGQTSSIEGEPIPEGSQNAFIRLYTRLQRHCPAGGCLQASSCVLHDDEGPKVFDGEIGKIRFMSMYARREGERAALRDPHVRLVGNNEDWQFVEDDGLESSLGRAALALDEERQLDDRLGVLRTAVLALGPRAVDGSPANVDVAIEIALALIDRTAAQPLPHSEEERRQVVRDAHAAAQPHHLDGTDVAVRQRQKRMREIVRAVFEACHGGWFAASWVPLEETKGRPKPTG